MPWKKHSPLSSPNINPLSSLSWPKARRKEVRLSTVSQNKVILILLRANSPHQIEGQQGVAKKGSSTEVGAKKSRPFFVVKQEVESVEYDKRSASVVR